MKENRFSTPHGTLLHGFDIIDATEDKSQFAEYVSSLGITGKLGDYLGTNWKIDARGLLLELYTPHNTYLSLRRMGYSIDIIPSLCAINNRGYHYIDVNQSPFSHLNPNLDSLYVDIFFGDIKKAEKYQEIIYSDEFNTLFPSRFISENDLYQLIGFEEKRGIKLFKSNNKHLLKNFYKYFIKRDQELYLFNKYKNEIGFDIGIDKLVSAKRMELILMDMEIAYNKFFEPKEKVVKLIKQHQNNPNSKFNNPHNFDDLLDFDRNKLIYENLFIGEKIVHKPKKNK